MVDEITIRHLWPETMLVLLATWILVGGAFQKVRLFWTVFSLVGYALVGLVMWQKETVFLEGLHPSGWFATGPVVVDYLGFVLRFLALFMGALFTLNAAQSGRKELSSEYAGVLMLLVAGVMLVSRANELVFMFVSLELISVPTYVLLYLGRKDRTTSEATAKYFFLSILSSAILLYGMSFLYGLSGTTTLTAPVDESIAGALSSQRANGLSLAPVALVLVIAGLGFKIAAVPFHFYAPDVYQGATNANAGLLAIAPKIGGLAAMIRMLVVAMPNMSEPAWQLLLVISIASMTLGNVCALWQKNIRRLMAFSSIAHAGYMLIGVVVALGAPVAAAGSGVAAAVMYVIVYSLASAGTFTALTYLGGTRNEVNGVDELAGLGKTQPLAAGVIAICMVSLAGIPPLAGFWGKLTLFYGALQATGGPSGATWFVVLAIAGALNAAIASAYYLRVIAVMYFRPATKSFDCNGGFGARAAMVIAVVSVLVVGILPQQVTRATRQAEFSLHRPSIDDLQNTVASRE